MKNLILVFLCAGSIAHAQRMEHLISAIAREARLFGQLNAPIYAILSIPCFKESSVPLGLEKTFKSMNYLPQYTYIARPVYRALGGDEKPLISVPVSFAATDLVMHRVLSTLLFGRKLLRENPRTYLKAHSYSFVGWIMLSIPVAFQKYKRNTAR